MPTTIQLITFRIIQQAGQSSLIRLAVISILCLSYLFFPDSASAKIQNQIHRIEIKSNSNFTRISIDLTEEPDFTISKISGNRLRIKFTDTEASLFKPLRRYSDSNIGGLLLQKRGNDIYLTFAIAANRVGWRIVHVDGIPALSLDIGSMFKISSSRQVLPGRERIFLGAEKLLNNFDPPLKPEIPFVPTDRQSLKPLLDDNEQRMFLAAEGELYKGKLTSAEEAFSKFTKDSSRIRPLALYRLAEAQYRLQNYTDAFKTFKEAVKEWQGFLDENPAVMFYYGDSIARNGDLSGGRQLLAKLIIANADKKFAPVLLVRMADVLTRQGDDKNALAIYTTLSEAFKDNKANQIAALKLADRNFFNVTPDTYNKLSCLYNEIATKTSDFNLREEATFKHALLESINGSPEKALNLSTTYQKRFPKGVYSTVIRDMREDLVALVYTNSDWTKEPAELIRLVTDNQDFLATAVRIPGFLPAVSTAFEKSGSPLDLISLYAILLERPWIGEDAVPFLSLQIAEKSELLGDTVMARKVLQSFLIRNPVHAQSRWAREKLAAIQFSAHEMPDVRKNLVWILEKNERATFPNSYYYLGRALWEGKDYIKSAHAMELYLAATKGLKEQPPLTSDAYYIAALSRQASGDHKNAAAILETALKTVKNPNKDQFLYKLGELAQLDGEIQKARAIFERISKEGKDPDWQRLARQAIVDSSFSPDVSSKSKKK